MNSEKTRENARFLKTSKILRLLNFPSVSCLFPLFATISLINLTKTFGSFFSLENKARANVITIPKKIVKTHGFLNLTQFIFFFQSVSDALRPDMDSHPDTLIGSNIFDGLIRHDRLLTDSLNLGLGLLPPGQGLASEHPVVKTEHSYSMAGSDGDSIPDSPLSFTDTGKFKAQYLRLFTFFLLASF
jgi:hypothetical protein